MFILRGLLLLAVASSTVAAQGQGRGGEITPSQPAKPATPQVRTTYTAHDRDSDARVITVWYKEHPAERVDGPGRGRGRGRGLAIAPGYEKKLARSELVPVEYREYVTPAPVLLVRTLPPVRAGWEFVVIGNHVLLVNKPTWRIIDVVTVF